VGLTGTEGSTTGTATVATFTDANPNATVSDFAATINWGDGTSTAGTVVAQNGSFAVEGAHTYADDGQYTGNVTINDVGGSVVSANFEVAVNPVAGELVANGGFETGDFSGWSQSGDVGLFYGSPQLFITQAAHTGNNAAGFGSVQADGTISQNLTTVIGQTYTFDFWLANLSGGTNDFTAKIGGVTELSLVNAAAQPYTHYTYTFTATSTSTPIEFDFMQQPSEWHLDDVSVAPVSGSSPPPPPPGPPAPPVINSFTPNTRGVDTTSTINLSGTAEAGSTVTVYDGGAALGTAPVNAARAWTFVELNAANGTHTFTATDTDANGMSAPSSAYPVTVMHGHHHGTSAISAASGTTSGAPSITASTSTVTQSNSVPNTSDSIATMTALLGQYMATAGQGGASISTPLVAAPYEPAPTPLATPFHVHS
jgi:hypothetical protein